MSSSNLPRKLLRYLEKNAGQTIKLRELREGFGREQTKQRGRPGKNARRRKGKSGPVPELDALLLKLDQLGLIDMTARDVEIRDPFLLRAKMSFSPGGMGFAEVRGAEREAGDIFVAPREASGSLPGDDVIVRLTDRSRDRFEGTVIQILSRARTHHRMKLLSDAREKSVPGVVLDMPMKPGALLNVSNFSADTRKQMKEDVVIVVELSGEKIRHMGSYMHKAHFVRFEKDTDLDLDFARILMKYDLEPEYPPVDLQSDREPEPKNVRDWKKRKDLRELFTITIDGADSRDFDDALSLVEKDSKTWTLYVHIADVSYYVKRGSELDREARRRATSYYLSNRVIPMLPPALSENLCSLVADRNRLAFTAEMDVRMSDGKIVRAQFYKAVIRVDNRLTYEQAEGFIDGKATRKNPAGLVQELWKLAQAQKKRRMASGRIDLDLPEPKLVLDKNNQIKEIEYRDRLKSSILIEECMLSANTATAHFLRERKANTLYRVHDTMDEKKLDQLNAFFEVYNVPFKLRDSSYKSIQKALSTVQQHIGGKSLDRIFNLTLLRSFMQASYRPEPAGHWGLGFQDYCHFTSPIRRYPDLVVHRALEALVEGRRRKQPYTVEEVEDLGFHTSEQERRAMEAERDSSKLAAMRLIEKKGLQRFRGFITGLRPERVFLELTSFPAEAVVDSTHLAAERELLMPDRYSAFVRALGRPVFLGEEWELELERLDLEEFRIYCIPIWPKK